ncbi:hypothetical protein OO013_07820 [Mangrovivirga sp. M17]|uniref:Glycosyl-4,4'-diaponeurosporenoate acyltransferase n=1 Tax=Mangrovivirga halotolerans TaxID=2993936 RepID=A0ABT3RR76_9BACT|nr:hypothetical protein [Mangrovivirga halotolerans]MCX2743767.1 hypothetical protein [Mangrovivirga halotolerans]
MPQDKALEKLKYRLNLIIIALLCSTTLAPSLIFFVRGKGEFIWLGIFIAISYLISRLKHPFYDKIQFSQDLNFYKNLGVDKFKKFSSNGDYINRRIRKKYPSYRFLRNFEMIKDKLKETYVIERSHTVLFVFCLLTSIYAYLINSYTIAIILFTGNFLFNFYPNLLQQYNRIRYKQVLKKYQ